MLDSYNRIISYLRISVTDRCNLRCRYCMPEDGIQLLKHEDILSFDEIVEVVRQGVVLGITKIRLTGGEPLVRKGIVGLVSMIAKVPGIEDLAMTTNGQLLAEFAQPLAEAGLMRVNISLDTVDPEKYNRITRGGDLSKVISGIEAAKQAGLVPVKINCVIANSPDEPDAVGVSDFAKENGCEVRFIYQMNLKEGSFSVVEGGDGGDCDRCNRLRLTANGKVKPCLFGEEEYDVRELGIEKAIQLAVVNKPACGTKNHRNDFYNIGG